MSEENIDETKKCGIIMPIASMLGYPSDHWKEVKNIIIQATELIDNIKFKTEIVSNSDGEIDVIHKRIVQNIYNSDIVVCDISGKNPNVLFELGMRLTFDKPTIIIKDDTTDFIFDTSIIEHLTYPKDLRYNAIVNFKTELARRIEKTYTKALSDTTFSTFLGNFGEFKVPSLNQSPVSNEYQLILEELSTLRTDIKNVKRNTKSPIPEQMVMNVVGNPNLDFIIDKYVSDTLDLDKPTEIINKQEFLNHIIKNNFNPSRYDLTRMLTSIENAQDWIRMT